MSAVDSSAAGGFTRRLKTALVGDPAARLVYLNNFEVERAWAEGEPGLPGAGLTFLGATVNRMEEVGVLLADDLDTVVLKAPVDPGYAAYLKSLGLAAGHTMVVDENSPARSVTGDALVSQRLLAELSAMADGRTYLLPLGISADEELLAEKAGLPLAGPSAEVCKRVNGKIFSRELVDRAGLTPVEGAECRTVDQLATALESLLTNGSSVVVKESYGVSGRGMVVLDDRRRAERLVRILARRKTQDIQVVVERWIDKQTDLNYQFIVGRDGEVSFETVKTALTHNGVHRGHLFPPALRPGHIAQLAAAADVIGKALTAEGYYGVAGVDAMLGTDGTLYPCLEINARFNMATYQNRVAEQCVAAGQHALATVFELQPGRAFTFEEVCSALGDLRYSSGGRGGVLINNFATLNAALLANGQAYGRVYAICIGDSPENVWRTRDAADQALRAMVGG